MQWPESAETAHKPATFDLAIIGVLADAGGGGLSARHDLPSVSRGNAATGLNTWCGLPRRRNPPGPANDTRDLGNIGADLGPSYPRRLLQRDIQPGHGLALFREPAAGHYLWTSPPRRRNRLGWLVLRDRRPGQHRCPFLEAVHAGIGAHALLL